MSLAISPQNPPEIMSPQMRATLSVFTADPSLMKLVEPFVDLKDEEIAWDKILKMKFNPQHKVIIEVAYGIWMDKQRLYFDLFKDIFKLEANIKTAILRALAFRWDLKL